MADVKRGRQRLLDANMLVRWVGKPAASPQRASNRGWPAPMGVVHAIERAREARIVL